MSPISFKIENKINKKLGRAGVIKTLHGEIKTPAFIPVATKATVKSLTPEAVKDLGAQAVLANTYHLYLRPGDKIIKKAGGLSKFMNWPGPTFTDSGGFQAFSLGVDFDKKIGKIQDVRSNSVVQSPTVHKNSDEFSSMAKVDEDGVTFKSVIDGSLHKFTPEKSIDIQHNIGADIIFTFDECASPQAPYEYQKEALERTNRWAKRCIDYHSSKKNASKKQALFGIVQGGRFEDLRKISAESISKMNFDGFGIGGSFEKLDIDTAVGWATKVLPQEKPRHLLGIGEPEDMLGAIENGIDTFDCVLPTRMGRNGAVYTFKGKINILNKKFRDDFGPIDKKCECYSCLNYTRSYISHLFRSGEMLAATLASIHNLYFLINLTKKSRTAILNDQFSSFKSSFLKGYLKNK